MIHRKPKVSIVIVFYKNIKDIFKCINSIKKSKTNETYEIVVVDNGSIRRLKSLLKKNFNDVIYIKSPKNTGYGEGNNQGEKASNGKYLLILNPDTEVFEDSIDRLAIFLDKNKDTAIVAPSLVDEKGSNYPQLGSRLLTPLNGIFVFSFLGRLFKNNRFSNYYWLKDLSPYKLKEVDSVPGSAFMIRRDIFKKIGKFDKNIFFYFEEQDLGKRVKEAGYKIFLNPNIKVKHNKLERKPDRKLETYFQKSRFYYFKKHFGLVKALIAESIIRLDPYILILILFNLIFFIKPIVNNLYFTPVDILQRFQSFNIENTYIVKNSLLSDPITQFIPWFKFVDESIKHFSFPLWNPFNAGGTPFMANMQSAIFFPITFLFYILDFRYALILAPFSKLFLIGLFTYKYLQELGLSKKSSILGALAFNFAGFNITWLIWPHTNSILLLPLIFLFIEKIISSFGENKNNILWLIISYLLLVLSGHPETTLQVAIISAFYFLFRLFTKIRSKEKRIFILKRYLLSVIISIGLSLFILLPFLEYIKNSFAYYQRSTIKIPNFLDLKTIIFNIFPNLFGNPSKPYYKLLQGTNYQEYTGAYVGPLILLSSIISSIAYFRKNKMVFFYTLSIIILLPVIYYIRPISLLFKPINNIMVNQRLLFFVAFAMCVNASYLFEELIENRIKIKRSYFLFVSAIILLIIGNYIIQNYSYNYLSNYNFEKATLFILYIKSQFNLLILTSIFAYLVLNLKTFKSNFLKVHLISVVIFLQTGYLNIDYTPSIEKKLFYPKTAETDYLKNQKWVKTIEVGGNTLIMPDINLWYGFSSILSYDAVDIKEYKILLNKLFKPENSNNKIYYFNNDFLNLFGVKYILSDLNINNRIVTNQISTDKYFSELLPGDGIEGSFIADDNGLTSIRLYGATFNRINDCSFNFQLVEDTSNKIIFENNYECRDLYDNAFFNFNFSEIPNSKNKKYNIKINSDNSYKGNAISFWSDNKNNLVLVSMYKKNNVDYPKVFEDKFRIFENPNTFGEFYLVNKVVFYKNNDEILDDIEKKKYDLSKYVLLENKLPQEKISTESYPSMINVVNKTNNYIETKIISKGGYLVSTDTYYPGWKVYIDGKRGKILKANYAFMATIIPQGEHTVIFKYIPESFFVGLGISFLTVLSLILIFKRWNDK